MNEPVKKKIAALLQMTRTAGCSEAEAIAAAEKAAKLMKEHGLSEADVLFTKVDAPSKTRGRGVRDRLWGVLASNTNTALIYTSNGLACFIGQGPGPEIAAYLFTVLNRAIDKEVAGYKEGQNYRRRRSITSKRRAVQDFTAAMVVCLSQTLRNLFIDVRSQSACRAAIEARDQMFPGGISVQPAQAKLRNKVATSLGHEAGQRVKLAHGVGGQADHLQIGA